MRPALEVLDVRIVPTGGVSAAYNVTQDWGAGFQAQMSLANTQATSVKNWRLEFDLKADISSIWDARIISHTGNHYVIGGASYNPDVPAGGSLAFGFVASPGQVASPSNLMLNGVPLGGSTPSVPTLTISDASVAEGNSGTTSLSFNVSLSQASAGAIKVSYATADASAQAGSDYNATSGSLSFAPGETQKTIKVVVLGDTLVESDETLALALSTPVGASFARAQAVGTILNDDTPTPPPSSGQVQFTVTGDWGSGFNGEIAIKNPGTTSLGAWSLAFDFPGQMSALWDAAQVSHVGNHYVVRSAGWNDTILPGAVVSFGFTASPGGGAAVPSNFVLTGTATSGGSGGDGGGGGGVANNHAPTAVNDSATTPAGQPVTMNVLSNDTDYDQDALAVASFTQGRNGTVAGLPDGTLTYSPAPGYTGTDSFSYVVNDGKGGTATASVAVTVVAALPAATWPTQVFAPYVDMTLYPTYNLASTTQATGIKFYTLAFIVADPKNQPSWGGYAEYDVNGGAFDQQMRSQVAAVRALGGDVMVSFGGESGQELAQAITNVDTLKAAYQTVINAYNLTHIDFDIEGAAQADHASIDRRSQALASLQADAAAAVKPIQVWYTLPVLSTGLTADGLYVLQSAMRSGVQLSGVNIMAMDFGDSTAPNPKGQMGTYAIESATSTFGQLKTLYGNTRTDGQLWGMVGVTPMIGMNDQTDEVFDPAAAAQLATFAEQHGMGRISMWSLNRDRSNAHGAIGYAESTSSSLVQQPYDFSKIFLAYEN